MFEMKRTDSLSIFEEHIFWDVTPCVQQDIVEKINARCVRASCKLVDMLNSPGSMFSLFWR